MTLRLHDLPPTERRVSTVRLVPTATPVGRIREFAVWPAQDCGRDLPVLVCLDAVCAGAGERARLRAVLLEHRARIEEQARRKCRPHLSAVVLEESELADIH